MDLKVITDVIDNEKITGWFKKHPKTFITIAIVTFLAASFNLFNAFEFPDFGPNTATIYYSKCKDKSCTSYDRKIDYFTYRVVIDQQEVIFMYPELVTYKNCIVFDKDNWKCPVGNDFIGVSKNYSTTLGSKDIKIKAPFDYLFSKSD